MFTVKHIGRDGNEFAIEAESYEIQHDRQEGIIRVMTYDSKARDGNYTGLWAGVPRGDTIPENTLYIMNQAGATVSTICFNNIPENHWGEQLMQDDPGKLAA